MYIIIIIYYSAKLIESNLQCTQNNIDATCIREYVTDLNLAHFLYLKRNTQKYLVI